MPYTPIRPSGCTLNDVQTPFDSSPFRTSLGGLAAVRLDQEQRQQLGPGERDVAPVRHPDGAVTPVHDASDGAAVHAHRVERAAVVVRSEHDPLAVGRPGRLRLVRGRAGDADRLATVDALREQIEVAVAIGGEGDAAAVGRPRRVSLESGTEREPPAARLPTARFLRARPPRVPV